MSNIFRNSISSFFISDLLNEAVILDGDNKIKVYGYENTMTDQNTLGESGLTTEDVEFMVAEDSLPQCGLINQAIILNKKKYNISSITIQNGFVQLKLTDGKNV